MPPIARMIAAAKLVDESPFREHERALAEASELPKVVPDPKYGQPAIAALSVEYGRQFLTQPSIYAREHLIADEHLGSHGEYAREREPQHLAGAQRDGAAFEDRGG